MAGRIAKLLVDRVRMESSWAARKLGAKLGSTPKPESGRLPFDWSKSHYDRRAIIGLLAHLINAKHYLEIGCQDDNLFKTVWCPHKIGVDPALGGTHRMTSDEFFASNKENFDLIFIDGLHHYDQVKKDIDNSLACLAPGGLIGLHDCLPLTWGSHQVPRQEFTWNGDVWRAIVEIKTRSDIDLRIVLVDNGVAIVRKGTNSQPFDKPAEDFGSLPYSFLLRHHKALGLIEFEDIEAYVTQAPDGA